MLIHCRYTFFASIVIMEVITTNKGGLKIALNGYLYVKKSIRKNNIWWSCVRCRSLHCRGTIKTSLSLEDPVIGQAHNHEANPANVEIAKAKYSLKGIARETKETPAQIVAQALNGIPENARLLFPKADSIRKMIQRERAKLRTPESCSSLHDRNAHHKLKEVETNSNKLMKIQSWNGSDVASMMIALKRKAENSVESGYSEKIAKLKNVDSAAATGNFKTLDGTEQDVRCAAPERSKTSSENCRPPKLDMLRINKSLASQEILEKDAVEEILPVKPVVFCPLTPPRQSSEEKMEVKDGTFNDLGVPSKSKPDRLLIPDYDETTKENESEDDQLKDITKLRERQRTKVKRLQNELRKEEAKLLLLKKLRRSQMSKTPQKIATSESTQMSRNNRSTPTATQPYSSKGSSEQAHRNAMAAMLEMPQILAAAGGSQSSAALLKFSPASNQPTRDLPGQVHQLIQQKTLEHHAAAKQFLTFKQQQASKKLALRKELEKTLLQIPPPKPALPEINFIPNPASSQFLCLLGLEEVVGNIQTDLRKEVETLQPLLCAQCKKDFSPSWKVNDDGSKVVCSKCVVTVQKKQLKTEHTARLKAAFVKALHQEQEIAQKMQKQQSSEKLSSNNKALTAVVASATSKMQHQHPQMKEFPNDQCRPPQLLQKQLGRQQRNLVATNLRPTAQQIRDAMPLVQFRVDSDSVTTSHQGSSNQSRYKGSWAQTTQFS